LRLPLLDSETATYLAANYLQVSGLVPDADWHPDYRQAHLGASPPGFDNPGGAVRVAVRVL
jgi:hypothetical protein